VDKYPEDTLLARLVGAAFVKQRLAAMELCIWGLQAITIFHIPDSIWLKLLSYIVAANPHLSTRIGCGDYLIHSFFPFHPSAT
jgi:hypothetical protein